MFEDEPRLYTLTETTEATGEKNKILEVIDVGVSNGTLLCHLSVSTDLRHL